MSILGVNIGIHGCTATVYNLAGQILGRGGSLYSLYHPVPGAMELDADIVMYGVQVAIKQAVAGSNGDPIRAMSYAVQGETVVPVDDAGNLITPALTTFDARPESEMQRLLDAVGYARLYDITGLPPHSMYSLPKMLWWQRQHPDIFSRTRQFLCFGGIFLQRLGLAPMMDYSMAGRTSALDIRQKEWSREILDAVDFPIDLLPPLKQAGTPLGTIPAHIAKEYDLPPGVWVMLGGHDQACAALASGTIEPGMAMDALARVECLAPLLTKPVVNDTMRAGNYACFPHVVADRYLTLAYNYSGGALLHWYRETLGQVEEEESRVSGLHFNEILVGKASLGPSPVLVLPHFAGAGTPWLDLDAQGAIVGLTLDTTKAQLIKGLLDGLAYEMRINLDRLKHAGVQIDRLRVIGAGANSPGWLQIRANILNRPLEGVNLVDPVTRGAALIAGVGADLYLNYTDALRQTAVVSQHVEPQENEVANYDDSYARYAQLYSALRPVMR